MRHSLYIGAVLLALLPGAARGQAGPPGEVINQARKALAVTPSDTVDLTLGPTRGLYPGGTSCNLAVILADDTAAVTLTGVAAGSFAPLRVKRVMAANTTCTGIVGLW